MARTRNVPPAGLGDKIAAAWSVLLEVRDAAWPIPEGLAGVINLLKQPAVIYRHQRDGGDLSEAASRLIHEAVEKAPSTERRRKAAMLLMAAHEDYYHKNLTDRREDGKLEGLITDWIYQKNHQPAMAELSQWLVKENAFAEEKLNATGLTADDLDHLTAIFRASWGAFGYLLELACCRLDGLCSPFFVKNDSDRPSDLAAQTMFLGFWWQIAHIIREERWYLSKADEIETALVALANDKSRLGHQTANPCPPEFKQSIGGLIHDALQLSIGTRYSYYGLTAEDKSRLATVLQRSDGEYARFELELLAYRPLTIRLQEIAEMLGGQVGQPWILDDCPFEPGSVPPWPLSENDKAPGDTAGNATLSSLLPRGYVARPRWGTTDLDTILFCCFQLAAAVAAEIIDDEHIDLYALAQSVMSPARQLTETMGPNPDNDLAEFGWNLRLDQARGVMSNAALFDGYRHNQSSTYSYEGEILPIRGDYLKPRPNLVERHREVSDK